MNNNEVISILNGLGETCKRGEEGFRSAAEGIRNSEFRRLFNIFAQQRAQFISELQAEVHRLGGNIGKAEKLTTGSEEPTTAADKTIPFSRPSTTADTRDEAR